MSDQERNEGACAAAGCSEAAVAGKRRARNDFEVLASRVLESVADVLESRNHVEAAELVRQASAGEQLADQRAAHSEADAALVQQPLAWTAEVPAAAGWWWWESDDKTERKIVEIRKPWPIPALLAYWVKKRPSQEAGNLNVNLMGGRWAGPLPEPAEPVGRNLEQQPPLNVPALRPATEDAQ